MVWASGLLAGHCQSRLHPPRACPTRIVPYVPHTFFPHESIAISYVYIYLPICGLYVSCPRTSAMWRSRQVSEQKSPEGSSAVAGSSPAWRSLVMNLVPQWSHTSVVLLISVTRHRSEQTASSSLAPARTVAGLPHTRQGTAAVAAIRSVPHAGQNSCGLIVMLSPQRGHEVRIGPPQWGQLPVSPDSARAAWGSCDWPERPEQ